MDNYAISAILDISKSLTEKCAQLEDMLGNEGPYEEFDWLNFLSDERAAIFRVLSHDVENIHEIHEALSDYEHGNCGKEAALAEILRARGIH